MKTKLIIIAAVALLASSCSTGTYMTRTYDDDIYFSPGDVPPVAIMENNAPDMEKSASINNSGARDQQVIMSQIEKNTDGTSTVNNSIYRPSENNKNSGYQSYSMDNQDLVESDTTVYYNDDDVKYVINNYYDDNDKIDFAYRINRFHRPYYYSPFFYDDWFYGGYYSPFYSGFYGFGYDPWYSMGWGFGYPYSYYGGYYSPFSFGLSGYWGGGYYGGGYGGFYGGGYGGYYNGYYGGFGGSYNNNVQVARRRATNLNVPGGSFNNNNVSATQRTSSLKAGSLQNQVGSQSTNGNSANTWVENGHTRSRSIDASGASQDTKNATIVNDRRTSSGSTVIDGSRSSSNAGQQVQGRTSTTTPMIRPGTTNGNNVRRTYEPSTTGRTYNQSSTSSQSQNYTPSYNKPRVVNQSSYNNNYTRPRTIESSTGSQVIKSANSTTNRTYSEPRSSSTIRQTYQSSSTYSTGSSSSPTRSSSYSRSSSSGSNYASPSSSSYSTPASSSSGSSYSSGSSSSGSSSSGSSSSGGSSSGGSGHRR